MRNLVVLGGSSHPALTKAICHRLGVPECHTILGKFSNGETSVQIQESVRGKDVFIITTGCGEINEILMELFIMLSACKTASAKRMLPFLGVNGGLMIGVITVLPVFPYSRQPDVPYVRPDTPLATAPAMLFKDSVTVSSRPSTPKNLSPPNSGKLEPTRPQKGLLENLTASEFLTDRSTAPGGSGAAASIKSDYATNTETRDQRWDEILEIGRSNRGNYRQWVAQAGTLVADLLTVAGTDHVITMDLHVYPSYGKLTLGSTISRLF